MAVIKYQINGKADTKPINTTKTAVEGLFKKVENVDNKLKAFVGVKVFAEVSKAINNSLRAYDAFKKSVGEDSAFAKQMKDLQTTMAGTLGTVRDSLATSIGDTLSKLTGGGSPMEDLQEKIMKAGASLSAGFEVASQIVENIATNISKGLSPIKWDGFFDRAMNLTTKFGMFLFHALKDAFNNAMEFFRFLIGGPVSKFMDNQAQHWRRVYQGMGIEVPEIPSFEEQNKKEPIAFSISDETKKAFGDLTGELAKTAKEFVDNLAGKDVSAEFKNAYKDALETIKAAVAAMKAPPPGPVDKPPTENLGKTVGDELKNALSEATSGYKDALANINGILGDATGAAADKVREKMRGLDAQFNTTAVAVTDLLDQFNSASESINNLQDQLASAKTKEEIDAIAALIKAAIGDRNGLADGINSSIGGMNKLSVEMDNLGAAAAIAADKSGLLDGLLGSLRELGTVIKAVMTGNPIGLIITGISKLLDTFSGLEHGGEKVASVLDIITTFFNVLGEVIAGLGPVLADIMDPILGIVTQLAKALGVLLRFLLPIVALFSKMTWLFDALGGILYGVARIIAAVADGFGWLYNFVSDFVSGLTWGWVKMGHMATDNVKNLNETWDKQYSDDESGSSNNTASYTVSGDMYITINYEHSYVTGDRWQIAKDLWNEIRSAQAAGYIRA